MTGRLDIMRPAPGGLARDPDQAGPAADAANPGTVHAEPEPPGAIFSVRSSHLYLSSAFRDAPGNAHRGEVQTVLRTLRWDPIEGQVVALHAGAVNGPGDTSTSDGWDRELASAQRRLGLGPEVSRWLARSGRDANSGAGGEGLSTGLWLMELCSCFAGGAEPDEATRAGLNALKAYKAAGGMGIYWGSERFYWRRGYHLVRPGPIRVSENSTPEGDWHAEGGQYNDIVPASWQGPWRRRAAAPQVFAPRAPLAREAPGEGENARPADSFDPHAGYRFEDLEEIEVDLAPRLGGPSQGPGSRLRFRPFVLRFGRLVSWPPNWLQSGEATRPEADLGRPVERARLSAWYAFSRSALTMTWRVSPALDG